MQTSNYAPGQRIEMLHMPDDPDPIPAGTCGTITAAGQLPFTHNGKPQFQLQVTWDNGRSLSCICPPDQIKILSPAEQTVCAAKT